MFYNNFEDSDRETFDLELPVDRSYRKIPEIHQFIVKCGEYSPESIDVILSDEKLTVTGCKDVNQNQKKTYDSIEFKKVFKLPSNADVENLRKKFLINGDLVIDVPLKSDKETPDDHEFPKIINENGIKRIEMNFSLPSNINPSNIKVTCKNKNVIVEVFEEKKSLFGNNVIYFYRKIAMPDITDIHSLKCTYEHGRLFLKADSKGNFKSKSQTLFSKCFN